MSHHGYKLERTILFEDLGSSGFADRLMAEKPRIISMKAFSGADKAKSTRLYAMAASTVGSAEGRRCNSIEMVSRVACDMFQQADHLKLIRPATSSLRNSSASLVTTETVLIPTSLFWSSDNPCKPVSTIWKDESSEAA